MKTASILLTAALAFAPASASAELTLREFSSHVLPRRKALGLREKDVRRFREIVRRADPQAPLPPDAEDEKKAALGEAAMGMTLEQLRASAGARSEEPRLPAESDLTFVNPDGSRTPYEDDKALEQRLRGMASSHTTGAAQAAKYQFL